MTARSEAQTLAGSTPAYSRGAHAVAVFAAVVTWPLIFAGGTVTSYRVGLAVPDWPTTFQTNMFLYNMWNAPFGVRVEHTHRLYGAAVGLATIVLAIWFFMADRRRSMKLLGVVALVAVIVQGVLGGLRVTRVSTTLAAVHGVSGQMFFAFMVSLCVLTGRDWIMTADREPDRSHLRRRAVVNLALIVAQIAAGARLRHFPSQGILVLHALLATAVLGHAAVLAWRVDVRNWQVPAVVPSARAMGLIVTLQVILGIAAWWMLRPFDGTPRPVTFYAAMIRTGHQATGALLLASSVVLTLRACRHLGPDERSHAITDLERRGEMMVRNSSQLGESVA
jgi:cytochrome c oxidase assembly protein subunit 15